MCMKVDLPEPDGPTIVTNSAAAIAMVDALEGVHHVIADVILLGQVVNVDHQFVLVGAGFAGAGGILPAYAYISVATAFSAPAMP